MRKIMLRKINSKIRRNYADLGKYRVVDYNITNKIDYNHYNNALIIKNRIVSKLANLVLFHMIITMSPSTLN